jgi:DNA-binding MarR family transcriptional regulator
MSNLNKVIDCLTKEGSMTQIDLRKCTGFSHTYMSHLLKKMEKEHLINKTEETIINPNNKGGKTVTNRISLVSQIDSNNSSQYTQLNDIDYSNDRYLNDAEINLEKSNFNENELIELHLKVDLLEKRIKLLEKQLQTKEPLLTPNTQAWKEQKFQEHTEQVYQSLDQEVFRSSKEIVRLSGVKKHDVNKILRVLINKGLVDRNYSNWNNPNMAYRKK